MSERLISPVDSTSTLPPMPVGVIRGATYDSDGTLTGPPLVTGHIEFGGVAADAGLTAPAAEKRPRNIRSLTISALCILGMFAGTSVARWQLGETQPADASPSALEDGAYAAWQTSKNAADSLIGSNIENIPEPVELGIMTDVPFVPKTSEERKLFEDIFVAQPGINFMSAYSSPQGVDFNIYMASLDNENPTEYSLNPTVLEFIISSLKQHVPLAPENKSKDVMLQQLERLGSGERILIDIVYEVGDTASCINAGSYSLVAAGYNPCPRIGQLNNIAVDGVAQASSVATIADYSRPYDSWGINSTVDSDIKTDELNPNYTGTRSVILAHELTHSLQTGLDNSADKANTYFEGDAKHEIIEFILGETPSLQEYDFAGATEDSPQLAQAIRILNNRGELPPLINKK